MSRSPRSLVCAAALAGLAGFGVGACGGSSSGGAAGSHPGGAAAATHGGEGGEGTSGGSAGAATRGGTTGNAGSGSIATGGSSTGGSSTSGTAGTGLVGAAGADSFGDTVCNNGLDDDGDGLVDGFDPECTGPLDNDEGSFATGIPGDNKDPKWQDCFFDGNSGGGDDGCRYPTSCLLGDTAADDKDCELAQDCIDFCTQLTPNGCDCFGCCTVQDSDGTSVDIFTTSSCSLAKLDDVDACPRCQKSAGCDNPCGECELCPGKTVADLPASCGTPPPVTGEGGYGGAPEGTGGSSSPGTGGTSTTTDGGVPPPPTYTCDNGQQVCGDNLPPCEGMYCRQGCCTIYVR